MPFLPASLHKITPWKNGGGETTEVMASPPGAGLDDFDWRVSMASVASDGAFSIFPLVDRVIAVIEGEGIELRVGDATRRLTATSAPYAFPGDQPTFARLVAGPIQDLNVMTRRGRFAAKTTRHVLREPLAMMSEARETLVLGAEGSARIETEGERGSLGPRDAWRASARSQRWECIPTPFAVVYLIEIEALPEGA